MIGQVRDVAHDLHPGTLDHVALVPALRTHCADFARQHGLDVRFTADESLAPLSREVAVCLYRVLQEGLRHIANHAGVRDASVSLTQTPSSSIADRGRGKSGLHRGPPLSRPAGFEARRLVGETVQFVVARWWHHFAYGPMAARLRHPFARQS